jgi:DNA uptake protein ComE-like DNA-binding protein
MMTTISRTASAALAAALMVTLAACTGGDTDAGTDLATDTTPGAATGAAQAREPATPASAAGFLDPEAASREQLLSVPGMDSASADAVVAGRPYATMLAVDSALASHLSESERDTVYTRLWKPIDLNTATEQEILLIPGVGSRMRREFEEYRPYTSMEQFRREMGKYVDDAEVERLARYVEIR